MPPFHLYTLILQGSLVRGGNQCNMFGKARCWAKQEINAEKEIVEGTSHCQYFCAVYRQYRKGVQSMAAVAKIASTPRNSAGTTTTTITIIDRFFQRLQFY